MDKIDSILKDIQDKPKSVIEFTKTNLKTALTDTFKALVNEIYDVMDDLGEPKDQYHISIYPFSIERMDKQPVPRNLLEGIQQKLQSNQ